MVELRELIEQTKTDITTHRKAFPKSSSEAEVLDPVLDRLEVMKKKSRTLGDTCWFPFWQHRCDARALDTLDKGLLWVLPELKRYCSMLKSSNSPTIPIPVVPPTPTTEQGPTSSSQRSPFVQSKEVGVDGAPGIDRVPSATLSVPTLDNGTASPSSNHTSLRSHTPEILPPMSDEEVMGRLPHLDAGYRAVGNENKCQYVPGTRTYLLAELESWAHGNTTEPVRVLYGAAGTGKSTIAAELAQRMHDRGQLGASFFFVRGKDNYASLLFPSIAVQLARFQPTLRSPIVEGIRSHLAAGEHQQMRFQVEDLFGPLKHTAGSPSHNSIVIVVDGIDECLPEAEGLTPKLIKSLASLTEIPTCPVRLLITARPDLTVENTVRKLQVPLRVLWTHKGSDDDTDIKLYLRHGLSPDIPNRDEVISRLAAQAEGHFAYAGTVMEYLQSDSSHLSERVHTVLTSPASPHGVLDRMDDLYLTALRTAFPPAKYAQTERNRARLRRVLGLMTVLEQFTPPSPTSLSPPPSFTSTRLVRGVVSARMLASLLGPELACEDTILVLNRLRSVVLFDRDQHEGGFSPIHTSLRTFLADPSRCTEPLYQVDAKAEHTRLAVCCLRTLTTSLTRQHLSEVFPERPRKADKFVLERRLRENIPPALQYACAYWAPHVVAGRIDDHLLQELRSFVRSRMSEWIEMLGYMGGFSRAAPELQRVMHNVLSEGTLDSNACATMEDSIQLLQEHAVRLEECPSDVYILGPLGPASPMDSRASMVSPSNSSTPSPSTPGSATTPDFVLWQHELPSPTVNGSTATVTARPPTVIVEDEGASLGREPGTPPVEGRPCGDTSHASDWALTSGGPSAVKEDTKARGSSLESTKPPILAYGAHAHVSEVVAGTHRTYGNELLHPGTIQTTESKSSDGHSTHSSSSTFTDYLSVLRRAFPGKPGDKLPTNTKKVIGCFALLGGSLSPVALAELMKVPIGDVTSVFDALPSILWYDSATLTTKVKLLDENFARFLVNRTHHKHTRFVVDARTQHTYLAARCLEVLSKALIRNPCQLSDPTAPRRSISDIEARVDAHVEEHVRYAGMAWAVHLAEADPGNGRLSEALLTFVSGEHAFRWLEMLAWMGQLGVAATILPRANGWLEQNTPALQIVQDRRTVKGAYVDVRGALEQVRNHLIINYEAIEACPSSVY
ncbi:hypothetical protein C8Q80DRAFT_175767 [Daedaleopsis nitida]|nr:hypothetical protein C8Q80DRAFT_175767 [Daedaleopsis nitida]